MKKELDALIIDTETTGFDDPQPIEVACLKLSGPSPLGIVSRFCQRYRPSKPIARGALAAHHIMDEELLDCKPYTAFKVSRAVGYLIGHNVDFDWNAIGAPEHVKRIDTCAMARKLWPSADSHSQSALIYMLYRSTARDMLKGAHSAATDVANNFLLLGSIFDAMEEHPETWEELWEFSEVARVPEFMTFGKHKGARVEDVPADYVRWYLKQEDTDPYVVKALTKTKGE
jgi:exodeoxyribonuclease X